MNVSKGYETESAITVTDEPNRTSSTAVVSHLLPFEGGLCLANSRVLGIFLLSALLITVARVLAPFEVGTDQSVQLEAAQRLTEGLGLTTTNDASHRGDDLSEAPAPGYLVQWPPGFSLVVAGFLLAGVPLLAALKIIYGTMTLLGWLGWALVASRLAREPIRVGTRAFNLHYLLAALLPILTTPSWKGTDIFLWGGVPFFVLLVLRSSQSRRYFVPLIAAGLLFGFLCAMRYASAFLGLAAVLILFQASYPRIRPFLKRLIVFSSPSLIVAISLVAYMQIASQGASGFPAQLSAKAGLLGGMSGKVQGILNGLPVVSNLIFGIPLLDQLVTSVNSKALNYMVGVLCLLVVVSLPVIVLKTRDRTDQRPQDSLALSLSFLPLSLTIFLILTRLMSDSSLFKIRRYYEPLILCSILIFYEIAIRQSGRRMVKAAALGVVALFAAYLLIFNSALIFMPERRAQVVQSVLSFTPAASPRQNSTSQRIGYPAWGIYSWKEGSRLKVKQLYEANPEALFIAQEYPILIYDRFVEGGPTPGRDIIDYPGIRYLKRAYTSKPIKVFWIVMEATDFSFIDESQLKLIHDDPVEKTKIYESDLPAGYKFQGGGR
jgi:hypothetical protein